MYLSDFQSTQGRIHSRELWLLHELHFGYHVFVICTDEEASIIASKHLYAYIENFI